MKKPVLIFLNSLPILLMMGLIPLIKNDYTLTVLYIIITGIAFAIERQQKDITVYIFGFFIMIIFEYIFISTGVETFIRNSLFGVMPLWLPFLWAYSFVAMKRALRILT